MDRKIVQALSPFSLSLGGVPHMVASRDLYYSDDPVVLANPHAFADVQVRSSGSDLRTRTPVSSPGAVETATAEPGGRRRMSSRLSTKVEPEPPVLPVSETSEV